MQEGTVEAAAQVLVQRMRAGDLPRWHVLLLAYLGYEPASLVFPPAQIAELISGKPERAWPLEWASLTLEARGRPQGPTPGAQAPGLGPGEWQGQAQIARVVGVACVRFMADMVYRPLLSRALNAPDHEDLFGGEDPRIEAPLCWLHTFEDMAQAGEGLGPAAHSPAPDLVRLGEDLVDHDFGGEGLMAEFAGHVMPRFARLMSDAADPPRGMPGQHSSWWLTPAGVWSRVAMVVWDCRSLLVDAVDYADWLPELEPVFQVVVDTAASMAATMPGPVSGSDQVLRDVYTQSLIDWLLRTPA